MPSDARPRLSSKARLRLDRKTNRYLLLYPEKGMQLNATAADIVQLCTGEHTVADIIARLAEKYAPQPADVIAREVHTFLDALSARALLTNDWSASPETSAPQP
jgi:pyrroloquinoline quinone biosynthesis protein D